NQRLHRGLARSHIGPLCPWAHNKAKCRRTAPHRDNFTTALPRWHCQRQNLVDYYEAGKLMQQNNDKDLIRLEEEHEDEAGAETLRYLWDPRLDPLFWQMTRTGAVSAWFEHIPFAHWLVRVVSPRMFVELGTHAGVSYSAFCESVLRSNLTTQCYAVDTWKGDEHASHFDEEVFLE